jgi:hypothetical protein
MPKPVAPSRASGDIVQLDFDGAELPEEPPLDEPLDEPPLDEPLLDDPPPSFADPASLASQSAHA